MRDLLARKHADRPLDVQLAALRTTWERIPADQRPTFLARLDEVCRAWADYTTAQAEQSPGHPVRWDDRAYEWKQGGWLYGTHPSRGGDPWRP